MAAMEGQRFVPVWGVSMAVVVTLSGCGDDPPPPAQKPVAATPSPNAQPGAVPGGNKTVLAEKLRIEDRVSCSTPDRPTDPSASCDPKAPSCGEGLYCLQFPQGNYCEPCPERDGIRHDFKERDFVAEQNRDPFQSFLLQRIDLPPTDVASSPRCLRGDQMIATTYGYTELKLVGIVAMATQRKALMTAGREGYIIKRGDCVGKEKAVVKDIGTGYITFQLDIEAALANQRAPQEYSVQLNPKQLAVNVPSDLPAPAPRTLITPVVSPPAMVPPRPAPTGSGAPGPGSAGPGSTAPSPAAPPPVAPPPVEAPPSASKKS